MKQPKEIIKQLTSRSIKKMENKLAIEQYISDSIKTGKPITFFNWECPPRFLDNGEINYLVDLEKVFKGKRIDKYTEFPRVVEKYEQEVGILNFLNSLGLNYRFIKIIADSNAYYLSPESLEIWGERKIRKSFDKFKRMIEDRLKDYPGKTTAYYFTSFIAKNKKLYERSYRRALELLRQKQLVSESTVRQQFRRTRNHIGFKDPLKIGEFSLRTIASYAAEGMVFNQLSKTKEFSNCIWLNIEEVDDRTIAITNSLRVRQGIKPLPMIFLT